MKHTGPIKKVALLSILGLFLFIPAITYAVSNCSNILDPSTELNNLDTVIVQYLGNEITAIPALEFYLKADMLWSGGFNLFVVQCDTNNQFPITQCDGRQTPYIGYNIAYASTSEVLYHINTNLSGLNASKYFYMYISDVIGTNNLKTLGTIYGEKNFWGRDTGGVWDIPPTNLKSICYQALPPPTISISYPTGGNITCPANTFCSQPINWIFSANNLTAGSSTIVYMNYQQGNSIDPTKYTNVDTLFFTPTSTSYSNSIQIGTYLTADLNYTVRADLYIPPAGSPVATSTPITFSYSAGGYTYTTSTGFVGTTCNSTSVDFLTGLLCSAFVPQQISLTQFNTLYTKVSNKPPIGYLSAISTLISGTSTATTAIDNLNIPAGTSSPFTILRSGMIWILWLLFGFWVFTKIRHFQLW